MNRDQNDESKSSEPFCRDEETSTYFLLLGQLTKQNNEASLIGKPVQVSNPIAQHLLQSFTIPLPNDQENQDDCNYKAKRLAELFQTCSYEMSISNKRKSSSFNELCPIATKYSASIPNPDSSWFEDDDDHLPVLSKESIGKIFLGDPSTLENHQLVSSSLDNKVTEEDSESSTNFVVQDDKEASPFNQKGQGDIRVPQTNLNVLPPSIKMDGEELQTNNLWKNDDDFKSMSGSAVNPGRRKVCRCSECRNSVIQLTQ